MHTFIIQRYKINYWQDGDKISNIIHAVPGIVRTGGKLRFRAKASTCLEKRSVEKRLV
jgi:hypothetical protein